jgi:hypothetical protein
MSRQLHISSTFISGEYDFFLVPMGQHNMQNEKEVRIRISTNVFSLEKVWDDSNKLVK